MIETPNYAAAALLLPPTGLLLLALFALVALRRSPRARFALVALAVAGLLVSSLPVVAFALLRSLEPPPLARSALASADTIVILGGGRNRVAPEWGGITLNGVSLQRIRYGATLARQTSLPVFVTGGAPDGGGTPEGDLMRAVLQDEFGVAVRWVDNTSANTRGNARAVAAELLPLGLRRIVLVTHASHGARAGAEFERHGLQVVHAPTGLSGPRPFSLYQLVPNAESLRLVHIALREWMGALWYRLSR